MLPAIRQTQLIMIGRKPFPVTVIGVTVVEALGTNTGVPAAVTCTADHASPRRTEAKLCLIVEN